MSETPVDPTPEIRIDPIGRRKQARARAARRVLSPILRFGHLEASGGIVLLLAAVAAMIWANSPAKESYFAFFQQEFVFGIGDWSLLYKGKPLTLELAINDLLMAIFFLVVGLEIKREVLMGELSTFRMAALPAMAAIGGMVVPALCFVAFNAGGPGANGWAIPMATDIAFSLGILAMLGSKAPTALKVFLTALAIVDDLGAVLVIAIFYTAKLDFGALGMAGLFLVGLIGLNFFGVRKLLPYMILGLGLWYGFLQSGVHATIAGVVLAMTIPVWVRFDGKEFARRTRESLAVLEQRVTENGPVLLTDAGQSAIEDMEHLSEGAQMPLRRVIHILHPWLTFFIVPIFAFANAGVTVTPEIHRVISDPIVMGVVLGLFVGKPLGIVFFVWLAVKLKLGQLARRVTWSHMLGVGFLAGIGFTMSLFIANLAFIGNPSQIESAKEGILLGSLFSGVAGYLLLSRGSRTRHRATEA
ncbi:MAG: Na+/H+ antiporter NhaA [Fimbriimonadaceae bacterium]